MIYQSHLVKNRRLGHFKKKHKKPLVRHTELQSN